MMRLLHLPDEILCKIFEYLSPFDALYSFMNLNIRFNRLLTPFKQQIDFTNLSHEQFRYYINILLPKLTQEQSLYVIKLGNHQTPGQITLFNTLITNEIYRNYLNNIDKIIIESPRLSEFNIFIDKFLLILTKLLTLSIKIDYLRDEDFQQWTQLIVNSILSISSLINLSIEMPSGLVLSRLSNTIMFHSLINVRLNLTLITDLLILIQRIPNVEYLSIRIGWWTSGDRTIVKMFDDMRLNDTRTTFLNHLKKFHLTIDSILTFQFEHLEQLLYRIMNNQTTFSFTFILRNCLNNNSELAQLTDGKQWEKILSVYTALTQFDLFIRISGSSKSVEEKCQINSFKSKYFLEKKWFFSYVEYSIRDNIIFYSIPYKNKELFDISIDNHEIFKSFPINYTSDLLINQTNTENYQLNSSIFQFILNHFPTLQQLHLNHFTINSSDFHPINIPSLHTLKIEKELNVNLSYLLHLLPLINTLSVSYFIIYNQSKSYNTHQYDRIIDLTLTDIAGHYINEVLLFLNQFPNLHYLHIHIGNRRLSDEFLLQNLNEIIQKFPLLICLKLQLEKDFDLPVNWNNELNGRVKMFLTDLIFDGILINIWF